MLEVIGFNQFGNIDIILDGIALSVPNDLLNRHRQIITEWQSKGNMIPSFVPQTHIPSITRRQMLLGLLSIGITSDMVISILNEIEDEMERASALIEWEAASEIERNHPLVEMLGSTFNIPSNQIDALFTWAASI